MKNEKNLITKQPKLPKWLKYLRMVKWTKTNSNKDKLALNQTAKTWLKNGWKWLEAI